MNAAVARLAIVADDLTGAADTAAGFASAGLETIVTWPGATAVEALSRADAVAIDAGTRIMPSAEAMRVTAALVAGIRQAGVPSIYKKCDSLLRGHIALEVAAAREAWDPDSLAIVSLAFPDADRTTVAGRQYAGSRALDPPLVDLFQAGGLRVGHVEVQNVRGDRLDDVIEEERQRGSQAVVFDAETADDLRRIAAAGLRQRAPIVWAGTGGLARAIAERSARSEQRHNVPPTAAAGIILTVVGSVSAIARAQIGALIEAGTLPIVVNARDLAIDRPGARDQVVQSIERAAAEGQDVVITIGPAGDTTLDPHLVDVLSAWLRPCTSLVGGLIATGGDTATSLLRAWDVRALRVLEEVAPGVPLSIAKAPRAIPVITKAGAFGDSSTLVLARARMRGLHAERS